MGTKRLPVFQTIAGIFAKNDVDGPKEAGIDGAVKKGDHVIGTVTDLQARLLFLQSQDYVKRLEVAKKEHVKWHLEGKASPSFCAEFHKLDRSLTKALELVSGLFWESVDCSFPRNWAEADITNDWRLVGSGEEDPDFNRQVLFPDDKSPVRTFFDDIRKALQTTDGDFSADGASLDAVDEKAGEKVIGKITDPRVKALYCAGKAIRASIKDLRPPVGEEDLSQKHAQLEKFGEVVDSQTSLFWAGVREEVDPDDAHGNIGLRKDWVVVSLSKPDVTTVVISLSDLIGSMLR